MITSLVNGTRLLLYIDYRLFGNATGIQDQNCNNTSCSSCVLFMASIGGVFKARFIRIITQRYCRSIIYE